MARVAPCVKIYAQICTLLLFARSEGAASLAPGSWRGDSSGRLLGGGSTHRPPPWPGEPLAYIGARGPRPGGGPGTWSRIASQKHLLEKERYIRRKGPPGFQAPEPKEDPNVFNRTSEVQKRLRARLPEASIQDIWRRFSYSGSIRKGVLSGRQLPAKNVRRPNYYDTGRPAYVGYPDSDRGELDRRGTIKSAEDVAGIRRACRAAREILDFASALAVEGLFTDDIDRYVHRLCAIKGVYPATLNYQGFPKSVCTSVNEVACHGIPDNNVLAAGDLLKVDLGVFCDGYFGDVCETYMVMPMRKDFNRKFARTQSMGRFERNKLVYRSVRHTNLQGCHEAVALQTSLIKHLNSALRASGSLSDLLQFAKALFARDSRRRFNFAQDEDALRLATRLTAEVRALYERPDLPYEGRVVGLPAWALPACLSSERLGNVFTTVENPQVVLDLLDQRDEARFHKPHLFSHTFERDVELMRLTHEALQRAIAVCRPGAKISAIGKTIEKFLEPHGCRAIADLCGHGIGRNFHEAPFVPHEANDSDVVMEPGMVFTIEPIVTRSLLNSFMMWPDGWTLATLDGSKTAQFEHTVLITEEGREVLTARLPSSPPLFWEAPPEILY